MGVCIPCRQSGKIVDVASTIDKHTIPRPLSSKRRAHQSFFNASFFQNPQKPYPHHDDQEDEEAFLRFLKKQPLNKNKYSHMNSPLLRVKRESFHNSRNLDTSIRTIEAQSLRRLVSQSIKIFNNNKIGAKKKKEPKVIENNRGTKEFLRSQTKSMENLQNLEYFIPAKRTLHEELKDTLPNLKFKMDLSRSDRSARNPKSDENRSASNFKKTKTEKLPELTSILKKRRGSLGEITLISQNKSLLLNSAVKIKPNNEFKKILANKTQNSSLQRGINKMKTSGMEDWKQYMKVIHEGKVVIMKKNNYIVRNEKVVQVV